MTAIGWMLLGMLVWVAAMWAVLLLVRANRVTEGDDAEQRRTLSRPAELGSFGKEHEVSRMRDGGAL